MFDLAPLFASIKAGTWLVSLCSGVYGVGAVYGCINHMSYQDGSEALVALLLASALVLVLPKLDNLR